LTVAAAVGAVAIPILAVVGILSSGAMLVGIGVGLTSAAVLVGAMFTVSVVHYRNMLDDSIRRSTSTMLQGAKTTPSPVTEASELNPADFGNKTANLAVLQRLFRGDKAIEIPSFKGISHPVIWEHLHQNFPDFDTLWNEFKEKYSEEGLSTAAADILGEIQTGVHNAFEDFDNPVVQEFIDEGHQIMVRSTGREDTEELSNAGGNESIANVNPESKAIAHAISSVVASYFTVRSLGQRSAGGDDITLDPFMPVLLQVMIGENAETKKLPVSGVMYTTEGELSTKGVVQITSSWGHADGVVTGTQLCDTSYVQDDDIHQIISIKTSRRKPGEGGELISVENHRDLMTSPSLSEKQIQHLAKIGRRIEEHYGVPMDVEWTYDSDSEVFYLLQARPVPKRPQTPKNYLDAQKLKELETLQRVNVIGAGGGHVCSLTRDNTIIADSASEALEQYLNRSSDVAVSAVVIRQPTASNSHEAGTFRERGIPVLNISGDGFKRARDIIQTRTILVDTQEGISGVLPQGKDAGDFIVEGLRRHLVPKMESCTSYVSPEDVKGFFDILDAHAKEPSIDIEDIQGWNTLDRLLNAFEEVKTFGERAFILRKLLNITQKLLKDAPQWEREALMHKIVYNARHVWKVFNNPKKDGVQKMYAMNWLRAALLQSPVEGTCNAETLYTTLGAKAERKGLGFSANSDLKDERHEYIDIFSRSEKFILKGEAIEQWRSFITELNDEELRQLAIIFKQLGPDIVEIWLNSTFIKIRSQSSDASECLDRLQQQWEQSDFQRGWGVVQKTKTVAEHFSHNAQDFADPLKFDALLTALDEELLAAGNQCIEEIRRVSGGVQDPGLECTLLAQALGAIVNAFDDCIKGITTSPHYEGKERQKVERFAQIVDRYLGMATYAMAEGDEALLKHDPVLAKQAKMLRPFLVEKFAVLRVKSLNPEKYVPFLEQCWIDSGRGKSPTPADHLLPSPGFSVAAAALGSNVLDPERAMPKETTLEDFFTTVHQSLETVVASIGSRAGITMDAMPAPIAELCDNISQLSLHSPTSPKPTLQSIEYHYPDVKITFNLPLNFHSAKFVVEAKVDRQGDVTSLILDGHIFVSLGFGGAGARDVTLTVYALSTYSRGMIAPDDFQMRPQEDVVHFKWKSTPDNVQSFWGGSETPALKGAKDHIEAMIGYLQIQGKSLSFEGISFDFVKESPWVFSYIDDHLGYRTTKEQKKEAAESLTQGVLGDFSEDNVEVFLRHTRAIIKANPISEGLWELFDKILEAEFIWASPKLTEGALHFIENMDLKNWEKEGGPNYDQEFFSLPEYTEEQIRSIKKRILKLEDIPISDSELIEYIRTFDSLHN